MRKIKDKRRFLLYAAAVVAVFAVLGVTVLRSYEDKIYSFVLENREGLEAETLKILGGQKDSDSFRGVEIEGVYGGKNNIVQFFYGGFGIVPSAKYYGFYYSENDVPAAYQNCDYELAKTGENSWEWSDGTDNGGITKRITDNWFYYEAWF